MIYRVLADVVLVVHLAFVVFVIFGGLTALWRRRMAWIHLPILAWGAATEFFGLICPLTPLENRLRHAGGAAGYDGSFVEHYLLPLLYPGALTRELQLLLGTALVVFNVAVYLFVWRRSRR